MNKRKLESKKQLVKRSPFEATLILFKSLTEIAGATLSLVIYAYIIGWIQATAYFKNVGAEWIRNDLSTLSILSYSWIPIVGILVILYTILNESNENREIKLKK